MKLLMMGDLGLTGFGTVTTDLGRALLDLGVDVRFMSQNELGKLDEPFLSRTVDVATFETASTNNGAVIKDLSSAIPDLLKGDSYALLASGRPFGRWKPDAALIVSDYWGARYVVGGYVEAFSKLPTFHYCPVEGVDLPPSWKEMWDVIHPIAMSRFGAEQIAKVVGYMPPMVYHGVDTDDFHPVSPSHPVSVPFTTENGSQVEARFGSKESCKVAWQRFLGIDPDPNRVMVLRTDTNMPRKNHPAMLRALAPVLERNPNMDLVLHCRVNEQGGNLLDSISKLSNEAASRIYLTKGPRLTRPQLMSLYNAADLYVSCGAEGFGLTIAEAIACGVPAVGLGYSSVPEVIGPAGQLVPVSHLIDNPYDHFWAMPDEPALGRAVEYLVTHPSRRREFGSRGPAHVKANFSWATAARLFVDAMTPSAMEMAA